MILEARIIGIKCAKNYDYRFRFFKIHKIKQTSLFRDTVTIRKSNMHYSVRNSRCRPYKKHYTECFLSVRNSSVQIVGND